MNERIHKQFATQPTMQLGACPPPAPFGYAPTEPLPGQYTDLKETVLVEHGRLKTNEEWVAEASAAADSAAAKVLRHATLYRLKALTDNIIGDYERGVDTRSELVEEFANLVSP